MTAILFDYSRVLTACQRTGPNEEFRPHLFLWDLAKVIEGLVLYDKIYTTEWAYLDYQNWAKDSKQTLFDFSKNYYNEIFAEVFQDNAGGKAEHMSQLEPFFEELRLNRRELGEYSYYAPDIDLLPTMRERVEPATFQFLGGHSISRGSPTAILESMQRTRVLLATGSVMSVPYDPVTYREPIVRYLTPGGGGSAQMEFFREFETSIQEYLASLSHHGSTFQLPLFFLIALREAKSGAPDDIFKVALELRRHPKIIRLRGLMDELSLARAAGDIKKVAQAHRVVDLTVEEFCDAVSGKVRWPIDITLKFGLLPFDVGLSVEKIVQRIRDRALYPAFAHIRRLCFDSLLPLAKAEAESQRVLGVAIREDEIKARA